MEYHKLVRDKIPEIIKGKGSKAVTHIADDLEYEASLIKKIQEEVIEFVATPNIEELADIMEAIEAFLKLKNIPNGEMERVKQEKKNKRGGFEKRIILDSAD